MGRPSDPKRCRWCKGLIYRCSARRPGANQVRIWWEHLATGRRPCKPGGRRKAEPADD